MIGAKEYRCVVLSVRWLAPTVVELRIRANKGFRFQAGQFISLEVPGLPEPGTWKPRTVKRLYSFASAPEAAESGEFELCVRYQKGGFGSEYIARLKPGDELRMRAPFGHFVYETDPSRSACFIATGTGIAPMRSIVLSEAFQAHVPRKATLIFGARAPGEILYPGEFEKAGCEVVYALSRSGGGSSDGNLFAGRLTEYLRSLPAHWDWHGTDFYLCGNGEMIREATEILRNAHGVPASAIRAEAFGLSAKLTQGLGNALSAPDAQRETTKRSAA